MTIKPVTTKWSAVRVTIATALLLTIPLTASAKDFKPSPIKYDKRTLRSDYMAAPSNAIAVGRIGANKGKIICAAGALNLIIIIDPDTGKVIREYGPEYGVEGLEPLPGLEGIFVRRCRHEPGVPPHPCPDGRLGSVPGREEDNGGTAIGLPDQPAQLVDGQRLGRLFADSGNAGDAEASGRSRMRENPVHHGAPQLPVRGVRAFDQGDGLGQNAAIAGSDAVDIKFGIFFTHGE